MTVRERLLGNFSPASTNRNPTPRENKKAKAVALGCFEHIAREPFRPASAPTVLPVHPRRSTAPKIALPVLAANYRLATEYRDIRAGIGHCAAESIAPRPDTPGRSGSHAFLRPPPMHVAPTGP